MNDVPKMLGWFSLILLVMFTVFKEIDRHNPCSVFGENQSLCNSDMRVRE